MKLLFIFFYLTAPQPVADWQIYARDSFFQFDDGPCLASDMYNYLEGIEGENDALYLAYKGTALASSADCTINPAGKLRRFREGRKLIEQAIALDDTNAELRFLRLSVQVKAPYFLGYSSNIVADRDLLLRHLYESGEFMVDSIFTTKVLSFVSLYAEPTQDELKLISDLQSKL